jgi:HK97 family phage portal protein
VLIHDNGPLAGQIKGWQYVLNGVKGKIWEVDPVTGQADLLQLKTFHPNNDFYGLADTEPSAREIDTSNEAVEFNKNLLQNQGRPGMVVTIALDANMGISELTDKQYDQLERQLRAKYSSDNGGTGESLILQGVRGTKAEPYGFNPQELDFLEGGRELARRICTGYRVPPQVIGILGDSKFKNYQEARASFWEDTVFDDLQYIGGELNNWIYEEDSNLFIAPVLDKVPALAANRQKLWDRAKTADHLTINEKREMTGHDKVDGGDIVLVDAGKIPLDMVGVGNPEEEEVKKDLKKQGFTDAQIKEIFYA